MHLTTQEVPVQNLEIGMYISRLDVPWVQTPFPIQGFYITKQEELDLLSHYCNKVYIDQFLSKVDVSNRLFTVPKTSQKNYVDPKISRLINEKARFKPRVEEYKASKKLKREIKSASSMYDQVIQQISLTYHNLEQHGVINMKDIKSASAAMVKSIINNPNALAWLCRIGSENEVLHQQAVRSAVWALIFARHLGLSRSDLTDLGIALLLAPIGKSKLPKTLLNQQNSARELEEYMRHVELTLEETQKMFSASHQVNYILSAYCERNNGSGYPKNIVGNRIPFLARVAGIADYYEQLINPYSGTDALTPAEAISHLYNVRGQLFQNELIEAFIQAIGIYPTGSLVKLSNNTVGVIVEQPEKSRLRPRVAVIKSELELDLEKPQLVDLAAQSTEDLTLSLYIEKSLKSTSTDINANEIHEKLFGRINWLGFLRS